MEELIARINELSRKNKTVGLTPEETIERDALRQKYLENFKQNFKNQIETIKFVEDEEENKGKKH
ncbi:hypothetical protein GCM10010911_22110 [Paenibacillus nasutitermitis]|uniref:UPF0291 protein GCM10010911_22110 n=1 Tax=Paenibacillus nasutitermitis TaxID=1652958 RepID=A0A916YWA8_9BACL|nr:hypothetical protein GCM10010911_22110 [Paenibacillus nasutitermitis]